VNIAKLPELLFKKLFLPGSLHMPHPGTNERKYPYIAELAVDEDGLDVELGRRILHFHNSRHLKPRHGNIVLKERQTYYRWCFSDLATAHAFIEQFGETVYKRMAEAR
jgi:hypothetical protein